MSVNEKLLNAEILISRSFIASAQNMFGDSYKAIIRNIPVKYGKTIVEHLMGDMEMDFSSDSEKLQFLISSAISADSVDVEVQDDCVILKTSGCNHHSAVNIEDMFGLDRMRVCPVGIIGTCFIEEILGIHIEGGKKDPSKYDETGLCTIRFDLFRSN